MAAPSRPAWVCRKAPLTNYFKNDPGYGRIEILADKECLKALYRGVEIKIEHLGGEMFKLAGILEDANWFPNMMAKRLGRDEKEVHYLQEKIMPSMYIIIYSAIIFGLILTMAIFLPLAMKIL
jgi:hypothetical protein